MGDHRLLTTTAFAAPSAIAQPTWVKDRNASLHLTPGPFAHFGSFANHAVKALGVNTDELRLQRVFSS